MSSSSYKYSASVDKVDSRPGMNTIIIYLQVFHNHDYPFIMSHIKAAVALLDTCKRFKTDIGYNHTTSHPSHMHDIMGQ